MQVLEPHDVVLAEVTAPECTSIGNSTAPAGFSCRRTVSLGGEL
jgi:hypothetical protein